MTRQTKAQHRIEMLARRSRQNRRVSRYLNIELRPMKNDPHDGHSHARENARRRRA